jgi:hypothetical protein
MASEKPRFQLFLYYKYATLTNIQIFKSLINIFIKL